MFNKNGFTLIEIMVVMVIISIAAVIAIPSLENYILQGASNAAEHNLVAIYNAERVYYFNQGHYWGTNNSVSCMNDVGWVFPFMECGVSGGDELSQINSGLGLNIPSDNYFQYACVLSGGMGFFYYDEHGNRFQNAGLMCMATSNFQVNSGGGLSNVYLSLDPTKPIVLPGGSSAPNPLCLPSSSGSVCPTS